MNEELGTAREGLARQMIPRAECGALQPNGAAKEPESIAEPAKRAGPPDRSWEAFAHIPHHNSRRAAQKEYQRTLEEFRQTGAVADKTWHDFAHLTNPFGLSAIVFQAHTDACEDIEHWQEQLAEDEQMQQRAELAAQNEPAAPLPPVEKGRSARGEAPESVFAGAGAPGGDQGRPIEDDPSRDRLAALTPSLFKGADEAEQASPRAVGLLRGVPFDPDAPGRIAPYVPAIPQLEIAPVPQQLPAVDDQTEALLNAIIGECHFYMREVTFPSLCHAGNADDRMGWIGKAVQLAETGARVGKAVARLRHGPDAKESRHHITVENRVTAVAAARGEG